jgi:hypothetical protein
MRVQTLRQKRETFDDTANADARAGHAAERPMLGIVDADAGSVEAPGSGKCLIGWYEFSYRGF